MYTARITDRVRDPPHRNRGSQGWAGSDGSQPLTRTRWHGAFPQSSPLGDGSRRHDFFNDADAIAYPTGNPGLYAASYTNGVTLTGGTGRFAGATGKIASFGAVDLNKQQVVLRYEGQICLPPVTPPIRLGPALTGVISQENLRGVCDRPTSKCHKGRCLFPGGCSRHDHLRAEWRPE